MLKKNLIIVAVLLLLAAPVWAGKKEAKAAEKPASQAEEESAGVYKYLPEESGQQASFTKADYIALKLTAYNSRTQGISSKLVCNALQCFAWPESLVVNAYIELQEKEKANYLGGGKFSYPLAELTLTLQEAVTFVQKITHLYFENLNDKYLVINLYTKGSQVAAWKDFNLKVTAEGKKDEAKD
jgi:hypothetical protein